MADTRVKNIAKAIFDWLNGPEDDSVSSKRPPYTFNPDEDKLEIGVDGYLDCVALAEAIVSSVNENKNVSGAVSGAVGKDDDGER